jgi:hypothetical protein
MTQREKWQTINEVLTTLFMIAFVLDERYKWRDKASDRARDRWRERRAARRRCLTAKFDELVATEQAAQVRVLEELWSRT